MVLTLPLVTKSQRVASNSHWGIDKVTTARRYDLTKIMNDRYGESSTVIESQLPASERLAVI